MSIVFPALSVSAAGWGSRPPGTARNRLSQPLTDARTDASFAPPGARRRLRSALRSHSERGLRGVRRGVGEHVAKALPCPASQRSPECTGVTPFRCSSPARCAAAIQLKRRSVGSLCPRPIRLGSESLRSDSERGIASRLAPVPLHPRGGTAGPDGPALRGAVPVGTSATQLCRASATLPYHSAMRPLRQAALNVTAGASALRTGLSR